MRSPLPSVSRRARRVVIVLVSAVVLLFVLTAGSSLYADWLWYDEVGLTRVLSTSLQTRLLLFVLFGVVTGAIVAVNLYVAYRLRPIFAPMSLEQQNLERYRMAIAPRFGLLTLAAGAVVGVITGLSAQGQWKTWLLFINSTPFGETDEQYNRDISFYVFEYPFWRYVLSVAFTAIVLSVIGALVVHYLFGGIRLQAGSGGRLGTAVIGHLSVLLGLFVALKAVAYYFDRFGMLFGYNDSTKTHGASAADIEFLLPAKNILLWIAALCALVFFANLGFRRVLPPAMALILLGISAIVIGGAVPALAEQFTIKPNAIDREADYIERSITATRDAYGIDDIERQDYTPNTSATPAQVAQEAGTVRNARLLDPNVLSDTFTQLQQVRTFYRFNSSLDIDQYTVDEQLQDYIVALREMDTSRLDDSQKNWINLHTIYTHGYGLVAAPANQVTEGGQPYFVSGSLGDTPAAADDEASEQQAAKLAAAFAADNPVRQPRVYYGELTSDYAVVGKSSDGRDREFDRPTTQGGDQSEQVSFTYDGKGGVEVDSLSRRLLYSLYFRERNFLLSSALNDNSKVMYVRNPRERVEKVAPFLTLDGDPYPALVDGRIQWIIDGYTTSNFYPYSQRETLGATAVDSRTGAGTAAQPNDQINYIRNSVKATVDAYDGTVTLYQFDDADPVLKAWNKAFDGIIKPKKDIPAELAAHFRYPEDLFKVQRSLLAKYHVSAADDFFSGQDFWQVPDDPTPARGGKQPPFYVVAQWPQQEKATFQITTPMVANRRNNLTALISAHYDDNYKPVIQMLELPGDSQIAGPTQAQNKMRSEDTVRDNLNVLDLGDSQVVYGNLLTLPVAGGLLYVEPIYQRASGQDSIPLFQNVLMLYGEKVAYESTLGGALDNLFGAGASQDAPEGQQPGDRPSTPSTTPTPTPSGTATPTPAPSGTPSVGPTPSVPAQAGSVQAAESAMLKASDNLAAAKKSGDLAAIGKASEELADAVDAWRAAKARASTSPTPRPSG
ncbi:UPF0182 family protein [Cryptosporangium aurantiacum]|uniref:UPF0182 protein SAMN05443668_10580 n=1 Tax=Cryptosporangium aurantiacum TaxID=134849 RepID=A0A1M7QN79_9ACTN|nr:UPF0182 family protein [Cryptosporangium aurantiacum]SHN32782.1 hypothetical protein SAMN05443668_10580 [Cryptosporangium aurantiacum]